MLRRNVNYVIISFLIDLGLTLAAVALAFWLRVTVPVGKDLGSASDWNLLFVEAGLLYPVVFAAFSLYDPDRNARPSEELQSLLMACALGGLALAGLVYFTERGISRLALVYFYTLQIVLLLGWRAIARRFKRRVNGKTTVRRVLLVGGGEPARQALAQLGALSWSDLRLVGYLTDGPPIPAANGGFPCLGGLAQAEAVIASQSIDDVLLTLPAEAYAQMEDLVARLVEIPCSIWVVPDFFSVLLYGSRVCDLGGLPMISIKAPTLSGYQRLLKRSFDLAAGSLFLVLALPVMALVALAIRLDSPGPAIFRQKRVGENGRVFWTLKFRSMAEDAEARVEEVWRRDEAGNLMHKHPDDARVTRVGRMIRRLSLDELPQLINVLRGEMSLVGPRPELPALVEQYKPWQRKRLAVPPGITGWWQVSGRSELPMHLHTEYDLYYVQNFSLLLDIKILLKTAGAVLGGRGAF
jgi:exopolysaccharide biosynthesis polyprenyl glycosylphosphotransferase